MSNPGKIIGEIATLEHKLYDVCSKKAKMIANPDSFTKEEIVENMKQDISLCKQRAKKAHEYNVVLNKCIKTGGVDLAEEIKSYD